MKNLLAVSIGAAVLSVPVFADQVILDDLIVDGSACIGFDCANGESFGFDTLRLKENNLRIRFDDTSSSGSFPNNDWQLVANDSASGGANRFSIEDVTNSRVPFTIEAAAKSNSLYIDDGGRAGFGTSTPVVRMHMVDGNTPTLRLQQDGSSGFAPQTWDVAGNETSFFVRDATNGSTLPFRIRPGASSNLLYLHEDDRVGVNTTSPSTDLHVRGTDGTTSVLVEEASATQTTRTMMTLKNNGAAEFVLQSTGVLGNTWSTSGGANYLIKVNGANAAHVAPDGDIVMHNTALGSISLEKVVTEVQALCGGCTLSP